MEEEISFTEVDLKQEKFEDIKEDVKKFSCDLCDKEMVYKMALQLLEGLSTACVDNTTGDIFKSPGTVAADIRKEMLDYLVERSESFVAETFLSEGSADEERGDQPSDIISEFIEDFAGLKRNILSRVSGWVLSEMREDKIDDFVQEMELNSFWLLDRREAIAKTLLKNVDFKNEFHCNMKFKFEEELKQHRPQCGFRTMLCENEGCSATFSAAKLEQHDSVCPFKVLPCEQNCPEILMRREMDRHCITVCPMKPMNCPFYSIGCQARVPSCNIQEHISNSVRSHLMYALQYLHREASAEDVAPRADQIEQESYDQLARIQGVRPFTNTVKDLDTKLGPLDVVNKQVSNVEDDQSNSKEPPPSEDNNHSDHAKHPPEETKISDTNLTNSQEPSLEDKNKSDFEKHPPEDTNNSDTERLNTPQPPSEEKHTLDFEKNISDEDLTTDTPERIDDIQAPSVDSENPNREGTSPEEQTKLYSEVSPKEDFSKVEL